MQMRIGLFLIASAKNHSSARTNAFVKNYIEYIWHGLLRPEQ